MNQINFKQLLSILYRVFTFPVFALIIFIALFFMLAIL